MYVVGRTWRIVALAGALCLMASACGDDDAGDDAPPDTTVAPTDGEGTAADPEEAAEDLDVDVLGEGTATVTLDNGETFDETVACTLEEEVSGDQSILFTARAVDGSLDVTQFGDQGPNAGFAQVGIFDAESATLDTLWSSDSESGGLALTLDGSTITGSGTFFPGDGTGGIDTSPDAGVEGSVEVVC